MKQEQANIAEERKTDLSYEDIYGRPSGPDSNRDNNTRSVRLDYQRLSASHLTVFSLIASASQQYLSLRTNQHQPTSISQTNRENR